MFLVAVDGQEFEYPANPAKLEIGRELGLNIRVSSKMTAKKAISRDESGSRSHSLHQAR